MLFRSLEEWHRARIAAKVLRYGGEPLFGTLAPRIDAGRLAKQVSRLQTSLGHLNDLQTIAPFLARVKPHVQDANQGDFTAGEHFCRGWSGAATAALLGNSREAMGRLYEFQLVKS